MDAQPAFTFQDLFTFVIGDMAKAIAERDGETGEQQFARSQAAARMILGFLPRDVIEAMLAGHCVMVHEVMTATVTSSLRGDADTLKRGQRSNNLVGLNKAFNDNLDRLERYRKRPAEGSRDAPDATVATPADAGPEPTATTGPQQHHGPVVTGLNRAARRQAAQAESRAAAAASRAAAKPTPGIQAQTKPYKLSQNTTQIGAPGSQSPEAIAVNSEAVAALQSGDPAGFARALGIEHPCEAFLAAANTKGSPFDPHSCGPWPACAIAPAPKA